MPGTLVLLPMDDRQVNYDYPRYLARLAGFDLRLPRVDHPHRSPEEFTRSRAADAQAGGDSAGMTAGAVKE